MKELLYYPGFEVKDETWLKFALLYLDHISPIIPYINAPEESYLTPTFIKVKEHSDLICIKRPLYDDIDVAYGVSTSDQSQASPFFRQGGRSYIPHRP